MFVRIELRTYDIDNAALMHARQFTVSRRNTWLPDDTFTEVLEETQYARSERRYLLDRRASAERGVLVYRQNLRDATPRTPRSDA
jgi:hypothetical protein